MVARTVKGKGVEAVANKNGMHGKPLADPDQAIAELGGIRNIHVEVAKPEGSGEPHRFEAGELRLPVYERGTRRPPARRTGTRWRRWAAHGARWSRSMAR